jgi:hypothetical protein
MEVEELGLGVGDVDETEEDEFGDDAAAVGAGTLLGQCSDAPGLIYSLKVGGMILSNRQSY